MARPHAQGLVGRAEAADGLVDGRVGGKGQGDGRVGGGAAGEDCPRSGQGEGGLALGPASATLAGAGAVGMSSGRAPNGLAAPPPAATRAASAPPRRGSGFSLADACMSSRRAASALSQNASRATRRAMEAKEVGPRVPSRTSGATPRPPADGSNSGGSSADRDSPRGAGGAPGGGGKARPTGEGKAGLTGEEAGVGAAAGAAAAPGLGEGGTGAPAAAAPPPPDWGTPWAGPPLAAALSPFSLASARRSAAKAPGLAAAASASSWAAVGRGAEAARPRRS